MSKILFENIYKKIISRLDQELPGSLVYHNVNHTKYVLEKAVKLAASENITGRELELIKIAALYHDTGFLLSHIEHENLGCLIASRDLQQLFLDPIEIDMICGMIAATKIPQRPKNIFEKIVADADLFYLGTPNYNQFSKKLYKELKHFDPSINDEKWLKIQVNFLSSHSYHTKYGKEILEPVKRDILNSLCLR